MSENKHTPEPWRAFNNGQGVVGVSTDISDVCWTRIEEGGWLDSNRTIDTDYENARRIVACVNACAGVDTECLEVAPIGIFASKYGSPGYIDQLEKQRDELLAMLENIKSNLMHHRRFGTDTLQAWKNAAVNAERDAEEAIASVKG